MKVEEAEILPRSRSEPDLEMKPDADKVSPAVDLLLGAEMLVLVAGRELNRNGGAPHLVEIADLLGAPVFMDVESSHTPAVFPVEHPLYAGLFGRDPGYPPAYDVYWSIGGTMFGLGAVPDEPVIPRSTTVIHTGIDATEIGRNYPVNLPMPANVNMALEEVLAELRGRRIPADRFADRRLRVEAYHAELRTGLRQQAEAVWDNHPIASERLATELNQLLDPQAIVVSELVTSESFLKDYIEFAADSSGRRNLTARGGVLGWGVAAAVGAKIARPDRQVVALVGDGSFQFGVQALWTAVRYEVPIGIIIWNNGGYQANRRFLHAYGGRASETGKCVGAWLGSPDIDNVSIARGYGVDGERVGDPDALSEALQRCLRNVEEGRPYLVDVSIERRFGGASSTWYDHFSVAKGQARSS